MYTATLKDRVIESGVIRWVVEFSDGTDTFTDSFKLNRYTDVQMVVARRLAELNYVDTFILGDTIDPTVQSATQPTQTEIERSAWLNDWKILQIADNLISHGVITNTLPAYVSHKAKVVTNFKVAYIPYL